MTKREMFDFIASVASTNADVFAGDEVCASDVIEFCEKEVASIDNRNEKAKVRAAAKKAEADAVTEQIFEIIAGANGELITAADILASLPAELEMTKNKVASRTKKLVDAGRVTKDEISVAGEDGKNHRLVAFAVVAE